MTETNEKYNQHRYEINIVECAFNLVERMRKKKVSKITIGQYAYHLKIAIQEYKRSNNFDVNTSSTFHPIFLNTIQLVIIQSEY
jgi:hypothetical protein